MLDFFKRLLGLPTKQEQQAVTTVENISAPYKVPEPAATTPIPLVVQVTAPAKAPAKPRAPAKPKTPTAKAPAKPKVATTASPKAKAPAKPKMKVAK